MAQGKCNSVLGKCTCEKTEAEALAFIREERGRGGIRAFDSMPDEPIAADGGRVRNIKPSGRDLYIHRLTHAMDAEPEGSQHRGDDSSVADSELSGRDLWLRRLGEAQL